MRRVMCRTALGSPRQSTSAIFDMNDAVAPEHLEQVLELALGAGLHIDRGCRVAVFQDSSP